MNFLERIKKINELDEKRTQGEWGIDAYLEADYHSYDSYVVHNNDEVVSESRQESNGLFIEQAPKMARIIREQQRLIELMAETLRDGRYEFEKMFILADNVESTLAQYNKLRWSDEY